MFVFANSFIFPFSFSAKSITIMICICKKLPCIYYRDSTDAQYSYKEKGATTMAKMNKYWGLVCVGTVAAAACGALAALKVKKKKENNCDLEEEFDDFAENCTETFKEWEDETAEAPKKAEEELKKQEKAEEGAAEAEEEPVKTEEETAKTEEE
ncbi:MAG: hypothetical protein Q4E89_13625, partial [Eubacteriales bacterium]|nr:hypothetical protein [Eubacteriales bacterium]